MFFVQPQAPHPVPMAPTFTPIRMLEVELSQPLPDIAALESTTHQRYSRALSLVRLHTQPLGMVEISLGEHTFSAAEYASRIWQALSSRINAHLQQDGMSPIDELTPAGIASAGIPQCIHSRKKLLNDSPFVSILIATRDRPEMLATCLHSLLALEYPHYEIIVIDNAPSTNSTAELIETTFGHISQIRYLNLSRPGKSLAYNYGLTQAKGDIVAFTDDDVVVDPHWLSGLVRGFQATDRVACVTGMVLPQEIETPAQAWFEQYGGFTKGFDDQIFDMRQHHPGSRLFPYAAGMFGSGNSMAFKRDILQSIGNFDPALGPGTPAQGGEDLATYFQVITQGYRLVYTPGAIVHHLHRRDYSGLRKQMYGYGLGLTAYVTKSVLETPHLALRFALAAPMGLFYAFSTHSPKNRKKAAGYPADLTKLERAGMIHGPIAYLRHRRYVRHHAPTAIADSTDANNTATADLRR
jgi:glycosyltransferase involved in cell wall biosynthesis